MNRREKPLLAAVALLASILGTAAQDVAVAPPARNWTLPLFTKEGFPEMTLRGDEVRPVSSDRIDISGMTVTVFSGDALARVDSVLSSPEATFMINEKIARGDKSVRLVRDDVEVTGENWTYFYKEKKVLIARNARVVFHAAMPDILK
ncbi:MAG TPA: hypothetical protein VN775_05175 [Opitutaceae bacterium]|nr:hypothetical protein [Opitutaceae bacterium]